MAVTHRVFPTLLFAVWATLLALPKDSLSETGAIEEALLDGVPREESRTASAGVLHSCAITLAGGAKCWGNNAFGEIGDGTNIERQTATDVQDLGSGVIQIASGFTHTCALSSAGSVKCWGKNVLGPLGDGTNTDRNVPTPVVGLGSGVVSISAGGYHSCAVTSGGATYCWGENNDGELGDGTTINRNTPTLVSGLTGAVVVQAGYSHTCARTSVGSLYCWGSNVYGQLGDGTNIQRLVPTRVVGLSSGVLVLGGGAQHSCAITSTSNAFCWGSNFSGNLGDGTQINRNTPTPVLNTPTTIATFSGGGVLHTCALYSGQAACWGSNSKGQLGTGGGDKLIPTKVKFLDPDPIAIATGNDHTCALTSDGEGVQCWGAGSHGRLGNGGNSNSEFPVDVVGF